MDDMDKTATGGPVLPSPDDRHLISALAEALRKDQLLIRYQPQIRLSDGTLAGFEALARWYSPVLGEVEPDRFVPIAEEHGLIDEIGMWLLDKALSDLATIDSPTPVRVSVNVSVIQLRHSGFADRIARILAERGFPAHRLELEITESKCLQDEAATCIRSLRELGVAIAMDDFGAGFSNLAALGKFDFDRLKLDRSLLGELSGTAKGEQIIEWAVAMGKALGLEVISEGVETEQQAEFLRRIGCDYAQGYLYAPPLTLQQAKEWASTMADHHN